MGEERFLDHVKADMRRKFNYTCSICLTHPLPLQGSHCAHLISASRAGAEQISDAISLGLLPSTEPYHRNGLENGIIQCPTCHLGYFTPGRLVLSPPLPVLQWIMDKLQGAKDSQAVWEIFAKFDHDCPPHLLPHKEHYSLVALFVQSDPMAKDSYALYCNLPKSLAIINNRDHFERFEPVSGLRNPPSGQLYRIFCWEKAFTHSTPGILKLTSAPPVHGDTIDYWKLPRVKCHIILYIFLQRAISANSSSPEVALARKIYAKLLNLRGTPSQTMFPTIVMDSAPDLASISLEESSLAGDVSTWTNMDVKLGSPSSPGTLINLSSERRTPSGRRPPKKDCGHERFNNEIQICTRCFTTVPISAKMSRGCGGCPEDQAGAEIKPTGAFGRPSVASEMSIECAGGPGDETVESTGGSDPPAVNWLATVWDPSLVSFGATLGAGAILGVLGTLILHRRRR
ncbi:hypothetical protein B0H16DRAFT_1893204 [Mycena metata]|uniref:Uncharacterized protein n=1 Tax=Mycena metata TaxID=1033252 RepID=A0AAD7I166_9AGAR|nr:hypothetical protein B0H16DRAFT_1893204 [Mycena metata]